MGYVITHPEQGIYVGACLGLGFWSLWDAAGQDSVPVFDSVEQAKRHIASWEDHNRPEDYAFPAVSSAHARYASVPELAAAGLSGLLGDLLSAEPATDAALV